METHDAINEARTYADHIPPNEAATCDWVIRPLLTAHGYAPVDIVPRGLDANSQYPDYTILGWSDHCWYLEAKAWNTGLNDSHVNQAPNYANQNSKRWVVLSNGREWRLYDNHVTSGPADKLTATAKLDAAEIDDFLEAIGKESVLAGRLEQFARRARLADLLERELADANSVCVRALRAQARNHPGLGGVTGADVVNYFERRTGEVPPPPPPPDGIGLDELHDMGTKLYGSKPCQVVTPAGIQHRVSYWVQVASVAGTYLAANHLLPSLPYGKVSARYFLNIEPVHSDGKKMHNPIHIEAGGQTVYMVANRSAVDFARCLLALYRDAGVDPSGLRVVLKDRAS